MATDVTKLTLLEANVLVELHDPPERLKNTLIIIPKEARSASYTGKVISIGPNQLDVCVGDTVAFSRHSGIPLRESGRAPRYLILDASEVLLVSVNPEHGPFKERTVYQIPIELILQKLCNQADPDYKVVNIRMNYTTGIVYIVTEIEVPF